MRTQNEAYNRLLSSGATLLMLVTGIVWMHGLGFATGGKAAHKPVRATMELASMEPASGTQDAIIIEDAPAEDMVLIENDGTLISAKPLSIADAILYKKIFAWQAKGEWAKADELMPQLHDDRLMGHVLYQRYMRPTGYKASFAELQDWMNRYHDYPDADKVYKLALARMPEGQTETVKKPGTAPHTQGFLDVLLDHAEPYRSPKKRTGADIQAINDLHTAIRMDLAKGAPTKAYRHLLHDKGGKLLDQVEQDRARALIANSYMHAGNLDKAATLAGIAAKRSGTHAPQAGWVGGLVAWRKGEFDKAADLFEVSAKSPYASSWGSSASAYWASRAHLRAGRMKEVSTWLKVAAQNPRTFYGLIATRALGWDFDFNWDMPSLTPERKKLVQSVPAGRRAVALVAAGQYHLAERELRQINTQNNNKLREALLAYAHSVALPSFALRLAQSVPHPGGGLYDAALYPMSPWTPQGGFTVDRALIHAIIRQESRFNPYAESRTGAAGLMQLMPNTATYMDDANREFGDKEGAHALKDPQMNLDIGQRYVAHLLENPQVNTELLSLVIAYNAGPGSLAKWKSELADMQDDPLLFIESIPVAETRAFTERVMANYWIYSLRLKQAVPTLDAVAEGQWAHYIPADGIKQAFAGSRLQF